jgi:plastocyanin
MVVVVLLLVVSIVSGYSSLTDAPYRPNPVQISVRDTVTSRNDDSQPHTITSGVNGQADGMFDSSIMAPTVTAVIFKINYF